MGSAASRGRNQPTANKILPVLYYSSISGPCRAVLLAAKEAKIPLEIRNIDLMKKEHLTEDFLKINPDHTVPALVDHDFKLWESRAIMTYLIDKYAPDHSIYPKTPRIRARIDRLLYRDISFVFHHVYAFMFPQLMLRQAADPEKQKEVETVLEYLENSLEEDFFVGDSMTIADISIWASLASLEANDWKFERWPKVDAWRNKLKKTSHYEEVNKPWEEFMQAMKQRSE